MNFSLSIEQEKVKKSARDFLEKECPESLVREIEEGHMGYSPELWRKMAGLGWLGMMYPKEYKGAGAKILDLAVLYEEMGRAMLPSPHLSTVVLCGLTILAAGSNKQKAELLPKIVSGDLILTLALTEPQSWWEGTAWDPKGVTVRARPYRGSYLINGTKLFVHDAQIADRLLVVTKTGEAAKPDKEITLFLVDAKSPGITYTALKTTAGDKQFEVAFDKVTVPKENIVGKLGKGWSPLMKVLQQGAVLVCAQMVGAGQRVLELAVDHAKTRIQFEQPIGINQYVQEHCVLILSQVDGSRWATYQAAWRLSQDLPSDMEVAVAKAWTNDAIEKACWHAHQVLAGVGYTVDVGVLPLYSKRAKSAKIYLGDTPYHLRKVAEQIDKWPAPQKHKGKPLGLWKTPEEEQVPAWGPWKERYEQIRKRMEERRKTETESR